MIWSNFRFLITVSVTWPKYVHLIGRNFYFFSKQRISFVCKHIIERFTKIIHAQNLTNQIAVFMSPDQNWPIRVLEFHRLPDYRNTLFPIAFWVTWSKYSKLIGQSFCVFSKQRISFVFKHISERFTKIMHAQNLTNQIAVFMSRDQIWPITVLEFHGFPN